MSTPQFEPDEPRQSGMSTATKVVLILLALGGVMMVVCCGGMLFIGWFGLRTAQNIAQNVQQNVVVGDAERVNEMAGTFITIEPLPGFEPQSAVNLDLFGDQSILQPAGNKGKVITWSKGEMADATLLITLTETTSPLPAPAGDEGVPKESPPDLPQPGVYVSTYMVMGQPVAFQFARHGQADAPGARAMLTITGSFRMRAGNVTLTLTLPAEEFNEQEFSAMLSSIAEPAPAGSSTGIDLFDDD